MKQEDIQEIKKKVQNVEGYFGDDEGAFLYNALLTCPVDGAVVEIGSWKGRSTIWLAHAARTSGRKGKVHAVDPHTGSPEHQKVFGKVDTYETFLDNIDSAGVSEYIEPVRKTSENGAKEWDGSPIAFLWIDGAHEYDMVKLDFDLWSPYLVEGGIVAFHDTGLRRGTQGPKEFVEQFIFPSKEFKNVRFFETITIATKVKKVGVCDRIANMYRLYLKRVYQRLRQSRIPKPVMLKKLAHTMAGRKV